MRSSKSCISLCRLSNVLVTFSTLVTCARAFSMLDLDEVDVALALHVFQIILVHFHDVAVALQVGRVDRQSLLVARGVQRRNQQL